MPRLKTVVVCPEDHNSLGGAVAVAYDKGLIEPIFIGDPERIAAAAHALDADISAFEGDRRKRTIAPPPAGPSPWCARARPAR